MRVTLSKSEIKSRNIVAAAQRLKEELLGLKSALNYRKKGRFIVLYEPAAKIIPGKTSAVLFVSLQKERHIWRQIDLFLRMTR